MTLLKSQPTARVAAVFIGFVCTVLAVGATVLPAASTSRFASWAPGRSAPVTALGQPSAATAPDAVIASAREMATSTGGSAKLAESSLRLLTRGSDSMSEVWGFAPDGKTACMILGGRSAACPTAPETDAPGVLWVLSGGLTDASGTRHPDELSGIVSDEVSGLKLDVDGDAASLDIQNNAFTKSLVESEGKDARTVTLDVEYRDGSTAVVHVADARQ